MRPAIIIMAKHYKRLVEMIRKENLAIRVINREANEELLKTVPHRTFLDMAIICVIRTGTKDEWIVSGRIIPFMGFKDEDELFEYAKENTPKLLPFTFDPLSSLIGDRRTFSKKRTLIKNTKECFQHTEDCLWLLSNKMEENGAVALCYQSVLDHVASIIENSFLIIPSSIHEVLIIPDGSINADFNDIQRMVLDVNRNVVDMDERLSNNVYYYDKEKQILSQLTFSGVRLDDL